MVPSPRRRGGARWAVVAGSGLVLAGFWMAIARGPQPAALPAPPATATRVVPARRAGAGPTAPAAPTAAPAPPGGSPRLRTRGS